MKVSIIVPVYNVERYINRCFDSIVSQTFDNSQIECIFIDDCSPDNCNNIITQLISNYKGDICLHLIKHDANKGLSGARNTGTEFSKGDYIYYLDSDDEISPTCIEKLIAKTIKYPNVDIVQGNTKTLPVSEIQDWRDVKLNGFREYYNDKYWIKKHCFCNPRIPVNAWNKLISRKFIFDNRLFFKEGIIHEDEHWMFFVAKKINSIAFVYDYTCIHYIVEGSIMQTGSNDKSLVSWLNIISEMYDNVDNCVTRKYQLKFIYDILSINLSRTSDNNDIWTSYINFISEKSILLKQERRVYEYFILKRMLTYVGNKKDIRKDYILKLLRRGILFHCK